MRTRVTKVAHMGSRAELHAALAGGEAVYIGRANHRYGLEASPFANPFPIGTGNREEVIEQYRSWLLGEPELLARVAELRGKILVCWCWPLPCHGDVLAALAEGIGAQVDDWEQRVIDGDEGLGGVKGVLS